MDDAFPLDDRDSVEYGMKMIKTARAMKESRIIKIVAARLAHGVLETSADGETFAKVAEFRKGSPR